MSDMKDFSQLMDDRQFLDDFMQFLHDHNYGKINPCETCHFYGSKDDKQYDYPVRRCRKHKIDVWPDDYCGDHLNIKETKE